MFNNRLYNKYKGLCEPLLLKHTDEDFEGVIFRPATVCGYALRQRFDLSVNILTNQVIFLYMVTGLKMNAKMLKTKVIFQFQNCINSIGILN